MKKNISNFSILFLSIFFSTALVGTALAQSNTPSSGALSKITYPVAELGSCKNQADCKTYCDDSTRTEACVNYAEKKNLFSQEELQVAKKFVAGGAKGPGSCKGKKECQIYCEDKSHIDECVSYAESNGLMKGEDLQKAKKVQAAIKKGVKFPSCKNKTECDVYCEDVNHMTECIAFAKEAGFLSETELQNTDKVLSAVKKGVKPPACKGKEACDTYCTEASHADECVNFAIASGLVTSDEARIIKETGGKGPGGCKNKEECNSYCNNEANRETCKDFAIEHNITQPQKPTKPQQEGTGPENNIRQEGPGNNGGNGGQSGWSNGTGNGGGNGGHSGPATGTVPGNGAGQGGSTPSVTLQKPSNPSKCIDDCNYTGKNCVAEQTAAGEVCRSQGQHCRQVTCSQPDAEGNPPKQEIYNQCIDSQCTPTEDNCHAGVTAKSSACTTTKDVCVMNCQKASKPTKPAQPTTPPTKSITPPTQYNQPPTKPTQPPTQTSQPTPPTKPTMSYCGDGKCGKMEQTNSSLCPQDCGGSTPSSPSSQPN